MQLDLLDHLLTIASPQDAAELLRRLDQDLFQTSRDIELAFGQDDAKPLSNALHVLLGISGSIGADDLYKMAGQAHLSTKSGSPRDPADKDSLLRSIESLRANLLRRRQTGGARP